MRQETESTSNEPLGNLKSKLAEQEYLVACLEVWKTALDSGYPSESIRHFGFREEFLLKDQKKENINWRYRRPNSLPGSEPFNQHNYHNCVILKNGKLRPIKLIKRPLKPLDLN